jgi:tRNA(Ile)-lysidine synthase
VQTFDPQNLLTVLQVQLPADLPRQFCVAFSGGVDSSVLLHALVALRAEHRDWSVRAMYVDHQLQAASEIWGERCKAVAFELNVDFAVLKVEVDRDSVEGLESAARNARYGALRQALRPQEILLTAHHADDQAETVLMALLRGSGVQGLAAMPVSKPWPPGWHMRPLLSFTRSAIEKWARDQGITGIDDPTNQVLRHDRNFLRHEVLPLLSSRWPAAAANIARGADHAGESLELLEEIAAADLSACCLGAALRIDALFALSGPRRRNLLRYWLRSQGLRMPSTRKLAGLELDLRVAAPDRIPTVRWLDVELFWHRGLLYARSEQPELPSQISWNWREPLRLPALGSLSLQPAAAGLATDKLPDMLTVKFRAGGERIRLPGREHRHHLKKLLQESGVLPWWRDRMPLLFAGKKLVAVGDLFVGDEFIARDGQPASSVVWSGAPNWRAMGESLVVSQTGD